MDATLGDGSADAELPETSPFRSLKEARQFEGPLPHTFDFEKETNSIVIVEGVRQNWLPRSISVDVKTLDFFKYPLSKTPNHAWRVRLH